MDPLLDGLHEPLVLEEDLELHNKYTIRYHTIRYDTISYDTVILWSPVLVPGLLLLRGEGPLHGRVHLGALQRPVGLRLWFKAVAEELGARLMLSSRPRSRSKLVCVCV